MTSVETKLRTAALLNTGLTALLGGATSANFRWFEAQLKQGTDMPAIVVTLVSNTTDYAFPYAMTTGFSRYQFDVWDTDPERARQVEAALESFLATFNAYGYTGLVNNANFIVNQRTQVYPQTQPMRFQRTTDAKIFNNSAVN